MSAPFASPFAQLLHAAQQQPEPQRLLFVFAGVELPDDASAEQRRAFEQGHGGSPVPWMTVDKNPSDLTTFEALADEASAMRPDWRLVFIAALSGRGAQAPAQADVERALANMEDAIKQGRIGSLMVLDRTGEMLRMG